MSGIVGSYFNTRGSGVVAKLGTDGQVFTSTGAGLSQGFETAAGGAHIKIDTQTASTSSSISLTGMDSTYQNYMVELNGLISTADNVILKMRFIQGGSTVTTSNHRSMATRFRISAGSDFHEDGTSDDYMRLAVGLGSNAEFTANGRIFIYGSQNSDSYTQYTGQLSVGHYEDNDEQLHLCHGRIDVDTTTTGLTFGLITGDMTAGTFRLYGIT